jgi:hypothetical protein
VGAGTTTSGGMAVGGAEGAVGPRQPWSRRRSDKWRLSARVSRPTSNTGVGDELINASGAFRRPAYLHGNGSPREHPRIKNSGWKKQRTAHQLKQI